MPSSEEPRGVEPLLETLDSLTMGDELGGGGISGALVVGLEPLPLLVNRFNLEVLLFPSSNKSTTLRVLDDDFF
jgi:hypothetical protein